MDTVTQIRVSRDAPPYRYWDAIARFTTAPAIVFVARASDIVRTEWIALATLTLIDTCYTWPWDAHMIVQHDPTVSCRIKNNGATQKHEHFSQSITQLDRANGFALTIVPLLTWVWVLQLKQSKAFIE